MGPIRLITYNASSQVVDVLDIYYNQVQISRHLVFISVNQGIKLQTVGGFISFPDATIQTTAFLGDSNYALLNATNTFTGDNNFNHGLNITGAQFLSTYVNMDMYENYFWGSIATRQGVISVNGFSVQNTLDINAITYALIDSTGNISCASLSTSGNISTSTSLTLPNNTTP